MRGSGSVTDPSFVGMTGGEEQRKKSKGKSGKAADERNPLPVEAGSWEPEGPAVIATRPTAKSHLQRCPCEEAAADAAIPI